MTFPLHKLGVLALNHQSTRGQCIVDVYCLYLASITATKVTLGQITSVSTASVDGIECARHIDV